MVEKIKNLIEQPITEKGYILDSVSYEKEAGVNTGKKKLYYISIREV